MIVVPLFVDDLTIAKDFYCSKLQFSIKGQEGEGGFYIYDNPLLSKNEKNNMSFLVKKPQKKGFSKDLYDNGYCIFFENYNVKDFYIAIENKIPNFDGEIENLPPGHFHGMYEYPGGLYLSILDPFGNHLIFTEW